MCGCRKAPSNMMQELTVNTGKRSVSNSIIFTAMNTKAKEKLFSFLHFYSARGQIIESALIFLCEKR